MTTILDARIEPGGRKVRYTVSAEGGLLGPYIADYSGGDVVSVAAAHFASLGPQAYVAPDLPADEAARIARERLVNEASALLAATDYVEFRVPTPDRTPSPAWLAWREQLREVVRGNATEIPPEPERYNAP